jgi:hypothetical protein
VRRRALALAALAALCAGLLAAYAPATVIRAGNLIIALDGSVSPSKLSRRTPTPIALRLAGKIATSDGTHVPAAKTVALKFDRHGKIDTRGLPTCAPNRLQSTLTSQAKKICGPALVGSGRVTAEIAFPEQPPFEASGQLLIFNGPPRGGRPVFVFHAYAYVPAPTTFVTEGVIGSASGKYGTSTVVKVPTIVGGQGSLTGFKVKVHKTWTYKGRRRSLLLATCPTGRLYAHGEFSFVGGTEVVGDIAKGCMPGG